MKKLKISLIAAIFALSCSEDKESPSECIIGSDMAEVDAIICDYIADNYPDYIEEFNKQNPTKTCVSGNRISNNMSSEASSHQRAGELILTAYPSNSNRDAYIEWRYSLDYSLYFGSSPENGEADPTKPALGGGYQFVKNGFPGESNVNGDLKVSPTRCTREVTPLDPDWNSFESVSNCLNFHMAVQQPFMLIVTVYNEGCKTVTQYRETVTEQEFRYIVQGPNYAVPESDLPLASGQCEKPNSNNYGSPNTLTTNGWVNVNVNIYPFSANGLNFENGTYITKIDLVNLPYRGCQNFGGYADMVKLGFKRVQFQEPFYWRDGLQRNTKSSTTN